MLGSKLKMLLFFPTRGVSYLDPGGSSESVPNRLLDCLALRRPAAHRACVFFNDTATTEIYTMPYTLSLQTLFRSPPTPTAGAYHHGLPHRQGLPPGPTARAYPTAYPHHRGLPPGPTPTTYPPAPPPRQAPPPGPNPPPSPTTVAYHPSQQPSPTAHHTTTTVAHHLLLPPLQSNHQSHP